MINKYKQKGAETVEFTIISLLVFAVLFAIIEFSRALFVWNALAEATRRGARMAAVCPVPAAGGTSPQAQQAAIFNAISSSSGTSSIIGGLTPAMIGVRYLSNAGAVVTNPIFTNFVEVSITGYTHNLIIPLWGSSISAPAFRTTLPSESLGAFPTYPGEALVAPRCDY